MWIINTYTPNNRKKIILIRVPGKTPLLNVYLALAMLSAPWFAYKSVLFLYL